MTGRWWRGITSAAKLPALVLGGSGCRGMDRFAAEERLRNGLVILLPGIQGKSVVEASIAQGLVDGGVESAVEVFDWTSGCWPLMGWHLTAHGRNRRIAQLIAVRIEEYRTQFPDRPVHLIGHSGGAGMALFALEALPDDVMITGAILLAAAVSPDYSLKTSMEHVEQCLWNFHSILDGPVLGLGAMVIGTLDRRHRVAAGAAGFEKDYPLPTSEVHCERLHQIPFNLRMCGSGNLGGHFGWTNRLFVSDWLAPIVTTGALPSR
mgnify:CR=1 FL=1